MTLRKCGECAHAREASPTLRRHIPGIIECTEQDCYVRNEDAQCPYFQPSGTCGTDERTDSRTRERE